MSEQAKPWDGVPVNPERNGWHWVNGTPRHWDVWDDGPTWALAGGFYKPSEWAHRTYQGPCHTPAEVTALTSAAWQAGWAAGREAAAEIGDAWAEENFLLAGDTVLMDPVLRGDISDAACEKSQTLQLHGAGHAYAAHAAQNIAASVRALPVPPPPGREGEG